MRTTEGYTVFADVSTPQTMEKDGDITSFVENKIARGLWTYCMPIILIIGTFGNVSSILVFRRYKWRSSTLPMYLSALAFVDLNLLYFGLLENAVSTLLNRNMKSTNTALCIVVIWIVYSSGTVSAWLLVAVTLQRVMCVVWPHAMTSLCSTRKSIVLVLLIVTLPWALHSCFAFSYYVNANSTCTHYDDLEYFRFKVWPMVDMIVSSLVPATILLICNFILISRLYVSLNEARRLTGSSLSSRRRATSSTTMTLVILTTAFLLLTLPINVQQLWEGELRVRAVSPIPTSMEAKTYLAWTITDLLWYSNSALNFLFYCLSGSKFRNEFVVLLCCRENSTAKAKATATPAKRSTSSSEETKTKEGETECSGTTNIDTKL